MSLAGLGLVGCGERGGVWVGGCCGVFVLVSVFLRYFCHVFLHVLEHGRLRYGRSCFWRRTQHAGTDDEKAQQARQAWEVVKSAKRQPAPRYSRHTNAKTPEPELEPAIQATRKTHQADSTQAGGKGKHTGSNPLHPRNRHKGATQRVGNNHQRQAARKQRRGTGTRVQKAWQIPPGGVLPGAVIMQATGG